MAWLRDPGVQRIVFAKNCAAKIRPKILMEAASAYGKELEFIQTNSSPRTLLQGKGYGEGDMIRQALEKSDILRSADDFCKITGKLYAPGSETIFQGEIEAEVYLSTMDSSRKAVSLRRLMAPLYRSVDGGNALAFLRRRGRIPWGMIAASPAGWIDTRFYRVRRDFYRECLLNSYRRVQDALGYTLENAFFDDLKKQPVRMIKQPPIIIGTSGTLGTTAGEYSIEIRQEAHELASKLLVSS